MDINRFIRRFRRKIRPVGEKLEKGRNSENQLATKNLFIKSVIFFALLLISYIAFPKSELYQFSVEAGESWRYETLRAPFDFPIYKDEGVIESEKRNIRYTTPPYFSEIPQAKTKMLAKRDTVKNQLDRIFVAYSQFRKNKERDSLTWAIQDSLRVTDLKRTAWLRLTQEQWEYLTESYMSHLPDSNGVSLSSAEERLDQALLNNAWNIANQLIRVGILDIPLDSVLTEEIVIRKVDESIDIRRNKDNVVGLNEAFVFAEEKFATSFPANSQYARLGNSFFRAIFQPSLSFMRAETYREWNRKEERLSPTRDMVGAGSVIVNKGDLINDETMRRLSSLERAQREKSGNRMPWRIGLGQFMFTLAVFVIFFLYLYVQRKGIFDDNRKVLLIVLLFVGIIGSYAIVVRSSILNIYAIPVAIVPVMLTVLFDSRVALFGLLTLAFIGGHFNGYDFEFTFATLFAGFLGVFSVRDIKNRGQIFLSAAIVGVGYSVILMSSWLVFDVSQSVLSEDLMSIAINAAQLIVVLPLLWVFERAFDITTDLTLLELSDTNRPLLKELSIRAPGTFNHSLQVANLAEAAADAIGANALLTRVGALYHDIGKMVKPEYFVENQRSQKNPHDQVKPRMSSLIIASHVKEGLEIGRNYNLPKLVLSFIPMHHGTTLIEYFYKKAQEMEEGEQGSVLESEFRYPGPRPNSRETGILMLADSVEAASRSINEPTHKRLEGLIESIFKARVNDHQLDDTDLTFRDLDKIKETFLAMLIGIHHGRVKYPGQDREEDEATEAPSEPFDETTLENEAKRAPVVHEP
ncbi:MAG: HDIG domain-containing protein [Rhodothermaceae bacterium]|nr:HDIG domain-containing protein [Rhodothermaceae bacterium]